MRLLIALVVWAAAVAAAVGISSVVAGSIHTTTTTTTSAESGGSGTDTGSSGGTGTVPKTFDASTVKPTDSVSLFRSSNFAHALATARSQLPAHAQVEMVAIYPGYLSMTAVSGTQQSDVYVDAAGTNRTISLGVGSGGSPTFPFSRINSDVPAALGHRIATAGHVPESQLRYMVVEIDPTGPHIRWLVYPNEGNRVEYFEASGATGPLFEYRANSSTGLRQVRG